MAYQIGRCLLSDRLKEAGMSPIELARRLGIARQQVYKWTSGRTGISMKNAKKIAAILELKSSDDLFEWVPADEPTDNQDQ